MVGKREFPWMPIARAEMGIREVAGPGDQPRIVTYLKSTTVGPPYDENDETPWCSAFVNWCVTKAGHRGTNSAWARSWLGWGKKSLQPREGCIVIFSRGTDAGHVGFFIAETEDAIAILGGNQNNAINISWYAKTRLLGIREPA